MLIAVAAQELVHSQVAVVPVVANVGAALLPALLGMFASVAALLLRPRALLAACVARPWVPVLTLALVGGGWWWWSRPEPGVALPTTTTASTDWTAVALAIIAQRQHAPAPALAPAPGTGTAVADQSFRGGPGRTGHGGGPAPVGLRLAASFTAPQEWFTGSPLLHAGRIYAATSGLSGTGSFGAIYCVDAATGALVWKRDRYGAPGAERRIRGVFSSPALSADGRSLVVGQGLHPDADVDLLCLDTIDGGVRWTVPTPLHIESSPWIAGDLVVVGCGAIEDPETRRPKPGDDPGHVLGVRLADGAVLWRHMLADPESSPAVVDGVAYIGSGFNGNAVVALRTAADLAGQPRELWRVATPYPATGPVTVAGGLVLVGCGNGDVLFKPENPEGLVIALDARSGAVRWRTDLRADGTPIPPAERAIADAVLGPIAVVDGVAYCPVRNGEVVALDAATGALRWRQADPVARIHKRGGMIAGPAVAGGRVYAVTSNGFLGIIDVGSGKVLEKLFINDTPGERGMTTASPWVADGLVVTGSETGGLRIYAGAAP
jgi:outer membrane protein assembly factor BamB